MITAARLICLSWLCALAACTTAPEPELVLPAGPSPETTVAAIRAAAGAEPQELLIQPLRDTMVEDLRSEAMALERKRLYRASADALDRAIAINADDPALLQERAEAAVLLRDMETAERLAQRAFALGAQVGPLCRRHWATIAAARAARGDAVAATDASAKQDACKVAPPPRY